MVILKIFNPMEIRMLPSPHSTDNVSEVDAQGSYRGVPDAMTIERPDYHGHLLFDGRQVPVIVGRQILVRGGLA
jgi:hypothetical protein